MQHAYSPVHLSMQMIMAKKTLDLTEVMSLVDTLNMSPKSCKEFIAMLEAIFDNSPSERILLAVESYEYCVKGCARYFHEAANKATFQKQLLRLLRRPRGKSSFFKQLTCNGENWTKIQSKVLYLIQLCYDAFILQESKFKNIIQTYKQLRKQGILFPPRLPVEKVMLAVQTDSPILANIEEISRQDQKNFAKKLAAMGMSKLANKVEVLENKTQPQKPSKSGPRFVNIDEISQQIGMIRSRKYQDQNALDIIESIRNDVKYGIVKQNEQEYWSELKTVATGLLKQLETELQEKTMKEESKYIQRKMVYLNAERDKQQDEEEFGQYTEPAKGQPVETNLLDL